jgi:wobble nucleotide-excising tRNase
MVITKLGLFRNVGRFDNCSNTFQLKPLTLIYGENGKGKTTISAVLRSLASNTPAAITDRTRLGGQGDPHIVLETPTGSVVFQNGQWSASNLEVVVFDDDFIEQNVHSGLSVHPQHRSRLHGIVIGAQGVTLARQVETLAASISRCNTELGQLEQRLSRHVPSGMTLGDFTALGPTPNVDGLIAEATIRIETFRQSARVASQGEFAAIGLPTILLDDLDEFLAADIGTIEAAAVDATRKHLDELGTGSEQWVKQGMEYLESSADGSCPFCQQSTDGDTMITHYRAYFSEAYKQHLRAIQERADAFTSTLRESNLTRFIQLYTEALGRYEFWRQFTALPQWDMVPQELHQHWDEIRNAVEGIVNQKLRGPLTRIDLNPGVVQAVERWNEFADQANHHYEPLALANSSIGQIKSEIQYGSMSSVQSDLDRLRASKTRYTTAKQDADQYVSVMQQKQQFESQKETARQQLDSYRQSVFPTYQQEMNNMLSRFNTDFRVDGLTGTIPRGTPSTSYNLNISGELIRIDGGNGGPNFSNTLSSGDRNTLALSFFFAKLKLTQDLSSTVVVIDDPVSSLDDSRRLKTVSEVMDLIQRSAQVIVLSHSIPFLCELHSKVNHTDCLALEVSRAAVGSDIVQWDIKSVSLTEYDKNVDSLRRYTAGDTALKQDAAKNIRMVIEHYLRVARQKDFRPGQTLGDFIGACRRTAGTTEEILTATRLQELIDLNAYANRFHHDTNPAWMTALSNINDTELLGYVRSTLAFVTPQ